MSIIGEHAIVVGASVGGLVAARVLSESYERVTVVERDELVAGGRPRRGVPQGRHGHGLHPAGLRAFENLFPGVYAEMVADGGPSFRSSAIRLHLGGHALTRADSGEPLLSTSRPFLEDHLRRRVEAIDGVTILDGCDVLAPVVACARGSADPADACIAGVRVLRRRDGSTDEALDADLVVDATGRAGRALHWLVGLGFERPAEEELHVGVVYATRRIRLPGRPFGDDRLVYVGPQPGRATGMYLAVQENGWWILTVFGYAGVEPPREPEAFDRFVAQVAPGDVADVLRRAEPLSGIVTHRLPSSLRRRYERLSRFPAGFLVFGDAICSFNPIYGQGMTVAALQGEALRRELRSGRLDARRFFRAAARPVGDAWDLATGTDLSLPEVDGVRTRKVRLLNAYVDRVLRAAVDDEAVARAFLRVMGMLDRPSALMRPAVLTRTARAELSQAVGALQRPGGPTRTRGAERHAEECAAGMSQIMRPAS